jgi:hypothetical protein
LLAWAVIADAGARPSRQTKSMTTQRVQKVIEISTERPGSLGLFCSSPR